MTADSVAYHLEELSIANNLADPRRIMPSINGNQRRILDVGCGAGQTLIASHLAPDVIAIGIDLDFSALSHGRKLTRSIQFACAKGEAIPFQSECFDLVVSRVALPYMQIQKALAEMSRVLKANGNLWIVLHPYSRALRELKECLARLDLKGAIYRLYVLVNSLFVHFLGKQLPHPLHRDCYESCQTVRGIKRLLRQSGFVNIEIHWDSFFVVTAQRKGP